MKYSINFIDPFCMYTIWDLYNINRSSREHKWLVRSKNFLENDDTLGDVDYVFGRHLKDLNEKELKLVLLLTIDRINIKTLKTSRGISRELKNIYEAILVYECFRSDLLIKSDQDIYEVDILDVRNLLKSYLKGRIDLDDLHFPEVPETFKYNRYHLTYTPKPKHLGKNDLWWGRNQILVEYISAFEPETYLESYRGTALYKRPFRENSIFPRIPYQKATHYLRNILTKGDINITCGYVRNVKTSVRKIGEENYLNILHTPIDTEHEHDFETLIWALPSCRANEIRQFYEDTRLKTLPKIQ